jgi:hypothetical protein
MGVLRRYREPHRRLASLDSGLADTPLHEPTARDPNVVGCVLCAPRVVRELLERDYRRMPG